jgi:hypothetical protein
MLTIFLAILLLSVYAISTGSARVASTTCQSIGCSCSSELIYFAVAPYATNTEIYLSATGRDYSNGQSTSLGCNQNFNVQIANLPQKGYELMYWKVVTSDCNICQSVSYSYSNPISVSGCYGSPNRSISVYLCLLEIENTTSGWQYGFSQPAQLCHMGTGTSAFPDAYHISSASGNVMWNPVEDPNGGGDTLDVSLSKINYYNGYSDPAGYGAIACCSGSGQTFQFPMSASTFSGDSLTSNTTYSIYESGQWADVTYDFDVMLNGQTGPMNMSDFEIMIMPFHDQYMDAACWWASGWGSYGYLDAATYINGTAYTGNRKECYVTLQGWNLLQFEPSTGNIGDGSGVVNTLSINMSAFVWAIFDSNGWFYQNTYPHFQSDKYTVTGLGFGSEYGSCLYWVHWQFGCDSSVAYQFWLGDWVITSHGTGENLVYPII